LSLFGTDGVRGIPNENLTKELAIKLGHSAANLLKNNKNKIVIGRDTRESGDFLEQALVSGICAAGVDVLGVEVIPTPAIAYLTKKLSCCGGVVISASHNPFQYNGIKFFDDTGIKLSEQKEKEIEKNLDKITNYSSKGDFQKVNDAYNLYKENLVKSIGEGFKGISIALDCANGSAYKIAPEVFNEEEAIVHCFACEPDGKNINFECGSTYPSFLGSKVVELGVDLGLAFDGDADRVIAVDEKGEHVDGDFIMAICAIDMKERGVLKNNSVVTTVMTNLGFHQAMEKHGINVIQTQVGDKYVVDKMLETGCNLGGEQSGHIIFSDYEPTGDGILSGLKLIDIIHRKGKSLSELRKVMERLPQVLLNVQVEDKHKLDQAEKVWKRVKEAEIDLRERGRILVRPSGTESLVRVMIESDDHGHALETANEIAEIIKKELN
jgi:phosphoglucosamine mutase